MAKGRVGERVGEQVNKTAEALGDYLKEQRLLARLSLRQLADQAGVSNPYLSQIERGLKKPSAEILQQIAKALQISAETLYVRAGILDERDGSNDVVAALIGDTTIGERHKRVLIDIYESFRREQAGQEPPAMSTAANKPATTRATTKTTQSTRRNNV